MRKEVLLQDGWQFARLEQPVENPVEWRALAVTEVSVPHVWNLENPGEEGCCQYQTVFTVQPLAGRKYFLAFEAVGGVARVFLNGHFLGEHSGSYSRFCLEAGDALQAGENCLQVLADNTRCPQVNPLMGDFTYYGGIPRQVSLIETAESHFDLLFFGSPGVQILADAQGRVSLTARVTGGDGCEIQYEILNREGQVVKAAVTEPKASQTVLKMDQPRLWQGKKDPYLYECRATLKRGEELCDRITIPFGFRSVAITPEKGFLLNGSPLRLHGVAKHQDFDGYGSSAGKAQQERDMALIQEIGANAVRLSHYQHPQYTYDLCDRAGMVVWAEIPMLAMPDGNEGIVENACQQLKELILQNMHHPSICFWGIQNEIAMAGESGEMYEKVRQLNELVKQLDPTRISAGANLYSVENDSLLNKLTDAVGYNIYFGWYYGSLTDYPAFLEAFHRDNPSVPLGITEYGVDCNLKYHSDQPECRDYTEEFQCLYHETAYAAFEADPGLWGSFIWNMFDFSSAIRDEGGVKAMNCKGLVTYDRLVCKDSFYYYKACWSKEPFVYLTGRRYRRRCGECTTVKVYSNQERVTLLVNGKEWKTLEGERIFLFEKVPLTEQTVLTAVAGTGVESVTEAVMDSIVLQRITEPDKSYEYEKKGEGKMVSNWFAGGNQERDLKKDCYSMHDRIGQLLDNPITCQLLMEKMPEIAGDERSRRFGGMSLLGVLDHNPGLYGEEQLEEVQRGLQQIPKCR